MAERFSFFNSVSGDRKYKAEDWAAYFSTFVSNGVVLKTNATLKVSANGGSMSVTLGTGEAIYNGYRYENTESLTLAISTAHASLNRIDAIMIRWNRNIRAMNAYVVQGTPATSPTAPIPARTADIGELCVATIYVAAGATSIAQSVITDTRLNTTVCGIATMIGDLDTTTLYAQIEAALATFQSTQEAGFEAWFENVQETLSGDTAGNLLNLIQSVQNTLDDYEQLVPLWSGAWGAATDTPITIAGISEYAKLAFLMGGRLATITNGSAMTVDRVLFASSATQLQARIVYINRSNNQISVGYSKAITIAAPASVAIGDLSSAPINAIFGVKGV